jgi:hypothetical protein
VCAASSARSLRGWSRAYEPMCSWGPGIIAGIETLPPSSLEAEPNSLSLSLSLSLPVACSTPSVLLLLLLPPGGLRLISISPHHTSSRQPDTRCLLSPQRLLRSSNIYIYHHRPRRRRHLHAGRPPSKHGHGFAVRAPVLRPLHLLQHRARGKLLEKSDPNNETSITWRRSWDAAS